MGKSVEVDVREGYRLWAPTYDCCPNPLLALETRLAAPLLGPVKGARVIDLCAGTGRWMTIMARMRANVVGLDISPEMLRCAARKRGAAGRLVAGDLSELPFRDRSADLAICSFGISYVPSVHRAFREIARVARRLMVSDMHPDAAEAGWTRSFQTESGKYRISHHARALAEIEAAAQAAGFHPEFDVAGRFGEPEKALFARAGRLDRFQAACGISAVFVKTWV